MTCEPELARPQNCPISTSQTAAIIAASFTRLFAHMRLVLTTTHTSYAKYWRWLDTFDTTSALNLSISLQRGLQLRSTNENKTSTQATTTASLARKTVFMDRESLTTTTLCRHTRKKRVTTAVMTMLCKSTRVSMDTISSSSSSSSSDYVPGSYIPTHCRKL